MKKEKSITPVDAAIVRQPLTKDEEYPSFVPYFPALRQLDLSPTEITVYGVYRSLAALHGNAKKDYGVAVLDTVADVAEKMQVADKVVVRARAILEEKNLIHRIKQPYGSSSITIVYGFKFAANKNEITTKILLTREDKYPPFIPYFVFLRAHGLSIPQIAAYGAYRAQAKLHGESLPDGKLCVTDSVRYMALKAGLKDKEIVRARQKLEIFGLLQFKRRPMGQTSCTMVYGVQFIEPPQSVKAPTSNTQTKSASAPPKKSSSEPPKKSSSEPPKKSSIVTPNMTPAEGSSTPPDNSYSIDYTDIKGVISALPPNISLRRDEYTQLTMVMGNDTDMYIQYYASRKQIKTYQYASDYIGMMTWWSSDNTNPHSGWAAYKATYRQNIAPGQPGNSFDTDDFFNAALHRSMADTPTACRSAEAEGEIRDKEVPPHGN